MISIVSYLALLLPVWMTYKAKLDLDLALVQSSHSPLAIRQTTSMLTTSVMGMTTSVA